MCLSIAEEHLSELAGRFGTPLYIYDEKRIRENLGKFKAAFPGAKICYAYKANTSLAICRLLLKEGAAADVVSEGELRTALRARVKPKDIIFTNNAKTREELEFAIDSGVVIDVDSLDELDSIAEIGKPARISFRVNPAVNPKTHPKIATGMKDSKFGLHLEKDIALEAYLKASELSKVEIAGIQMHIGSQITDISAFEDATRKLLDFVLKLKESGIRLKFIDIGGGLGISYTGEETPGPKDLAGKILPIMEEYGSRLGYEPELWLEPGRYLVAGAGVLLCQVQSVKKTPYRNFVNVNAGFNVLARPAMYDSFHRIKVLGKSGKTETYDVVGNICESGDILGRDRKLPATEKGDILAILDAGAYGFSMASQYNSRPRPAEVLVRENSAELIRDRETWDDLWRGQKVPDDLEK